MSIVLSDEQLAYVQISGKIVLNACPGSGKTTTVAHKLFSLIKNWEDRFSKNAGIACLSFTNVAKNEIAEKYREINGFSLPNPHVISTIDSFINTFITLPFAHKIKDIGKRYRILDDEGYLDSLCQADWYLLRTYKTNLFKFAPSKIEFNIDNGYSWDGHDKSTDEEFSKYAKAIKVKQINMGLLKTSDSAFFALQILKKYPRLSEYLAIKFPYFIIDEAQDTSDIQHSIFDMLCIGGLKNIDFVGDPYQCLYQWRNARPELFLRKFDDKENWQGIRLTENRRSTKNIVDIFSKLRRQIDNDIVPVNVSATDLPLHIIKYDNSNYIDVIGKYERLCIDNEFGLNSILVRGNTMKNTLLGKETSFSPWKTSLPYLLIESRLKLQSNEVKDAVKKVRRVILELFSPGISFEDLKDKEQEFKNNKETNSLIFNLIRGLPSFDLSLNSWTKQSQQYLKTKLQLDYEPDFIIRKNNTRFFDKSTLENPVNMYFKNNSTDSKIPVTTIHQVKGMTFDSVLLLLSTDSRGQNISLNDFVLKEEMPTEKQRLIYVATSRPKSLLCIGVPNTVEDEMLKTQFNNDILVL